MFDSLQRSASIERRSEGRVEKMIPDPRLGREIHSSLANGFVSFCSLPFFFKHLVLKMRVWRVGEDC